MKTIQMRLDERLLTELDQVAKALGLSRSAYIRQALRLALHKQKIAEMEQRQADGYRRYPVQPGEFDIWETEHK